jgi:hypothetical protein
MSSSGFSSSAKHQWSVPSFAHMPNPSVKGTSASGLRPLAAAPYLER